jgi:hypothetical protein
VNKEKIQQLSEADRMGMLKFLMSLPIQHAWIYVLIIKNLNSMCVAEIVFGKLLYRSSSWCLQLHVAHSNRDTNMQTLPTASGINNEKTTTSRNLHLLSNRISEFGKTGPSMHVLRINYSSQLNLRQLVFNQILLFSFDLRLTCPAL